MGKTQSIATVGSNSSRPNYTATRARQLSVSAASLAIGIVAWELLGQSLQLSFLPPFHTVLSECIELIASGKILPDLASSLVSLAIGFFLAVIVGVTLGALMGFYRKVEHLLDVYLYIFLSSPALIYVPVLFALFGVSRASQTAVVFLYSVFIIMANTMTGVRHVSSSLVEMAHSFGATERQLFWKILLPGAVPMVMTGIRIGIGRAVKGMINGEMFIALIGLGASLAKYGSRFDAKKVLAILLVIVTLAIVCTAAIQLLSKRLTRWLTEPV